MAQFIYKAIKRNNGEIVEGSMEAESKEKALEILENRELSPYNLQEEKKDMSDKKSGSFFKTNKNELILFTRQLGNLLRAGIQLDEALQIIKNLFADNDFYTVVNKVHYYLQGGHSLSEALQKYPSHFGPGYINMIRAGEEGGFLGLTCQRLAKNLESRLELKTFIISSLIYPIILVFMSLVAIIAIIFFVLPKFSLIYERYKKELPFTTDFLLSLSKFISNYWWAIMLLLLGFGLALWFYYQSERGRENYDRLILNLSTIGKIYMGITITNITRSLGSMTENGVPLLKALKVSQHISNNKIIQEGLKNATARVKKGNKLAQALEKTDIFPQIVIHMIKVGEKTGDLSSMLLEIADDFETDTRKSLEKFMKVFEPALILTVGSIIGIIVISMLLPIISISNVL